MKLNLPRPFQTFSAVTGLRPPADSAGGDRYDSETPRLFASAILILEWGVAKFVLDIVGQSIDSEIEKDQYQKILNNCWNPLQPWTISPAFNTAVLHLTCATHSQALVGTCQAGAGEHGLSSWFLWHQFEVRHPAKNLKTVKPKMDEILVTMSWKMLEQYIH